ncbi:hypothetical protein MMC31_006183 [Peltigera leucophlebia]|nr:hypothetical protein [Peltigera leucophlebia]
MGKIYIMRQKSLISLLLTSLVFLGYAVTVAALPELHPRQQCDTAVCPDWSWFSTLGEKFEGTWQTIGGYLGGLLLNDPPEEQTPTNPTEPLLPGSGRITNPQNPFETDPTSQTELSSGTEKCPVGAPDMNYDSNDQNQNLRQCSVAPAQIVMPTDCTSPKNAMIAQKLAVMDPLYKTSRSPRCPGENGVVFWLANITPDQAAIILAETDGAVKGIAPDSPFKSDPLTPAPELVAGQKLVPRNTKKKRDILQVQVQEWDDIFDPSLTFLSTPPGRTNGDNRKYVFFETAVQSAMQQDIRVYLVDSGYDPRSGQIRPKGLEWFYGIGARMEESDSDPDRHGTCMASKIGGPGYGVLQVGPVFTIIKIIDTVASFLDSLGHILSDVVDKEFSVQGRAVVQISGQWRLKETEAFIVDAIRRGINALLNSKVMVVSPSPSGDSLGTQTETWPASLAAMTDMITVGAVTPIALPGMPYGSRYPWSTSGSVIVNAPGGSLCASIGGSPKPFVGPGMAAAVTTGLIAYFLAIPDLQAYFLAQPNWASAVKQYILAMSYPRHELVTSVWNGLDSADPKLTYNTPGDPWIGIPYPGNPRFQ